MEVVAESEILRARARAFAPARQDVVGARARFRRRTIARSSRSPPTAFVVRFALRERLASTSFASSRVRRSSRGGRCSRRSPSSRTGSSSDLVYDTTATETSTPLIEVIRQRRGVCQDFAHFRDRLLAGDGPARPVRERIPVDDSRPPNGPRLVGCDASHAWVSTYLPSVGWVDFDPVNNLMPEERHVTVAYGRDYSDVTPVRGVLVGGGRHIVHVSVDVAPLYED